MTTETFDFDVELSTVCTTEGGVAPPRPIAPAAPDACSIAHTLSTGGLTFEMGDAERKAWGDVPLPSRLAAWLGWWRLSIEPGRVPAVTRPARQWADPLPREERCRRYAGFRSMLRDWMDDTSGFDERVEPLIEETLRETAP